jgi:hypothetical protein
MRSEQTLTYYNYYASEEVVKRSKSSLAFSVGGLECGEDAVHC